MLTFNPKIHCSPFSRLDIHFIFLHLSVPAAPCYVTWQCHVTLLANPPQANVTESTQIKIFWKGRGLFFTRECWHAKIVPEAQRNKQRRGPCYLFPMMHL